MKFVKTVTITIELNDKQVNNIKKELIDDCGYTEDEIDENTIMDYLDDDTVVNCYEPGVDCVDYDYEKKCSIE